MSLRWKLTICAAALVVFAVAGVYPIAAPYASLPVPSVLASMQLRLGLDLKGGVHLVLRVQTDDALRVETEAEMERFREALTTASIATSAVATDSPVRFKVDGIQQAQDQARQTIERRVNELGVAEPSIAQQGESGDQILVQLPGVTDVDRAKEIIRSTGLLELKIVEQGPASTKEELMPGGQAPQGMEVLPGDAGSTGAPGTTVYYMVRKVAAVTGRDLRNARQTLDENNLPAVSFTLNQDGARKFGTNAHKMVVNDLDLGFEWQWRPEVELSMMYSLTGERTNAAGTAIIKDARRLAIQLQFNY